LRLRPIANPAMASNPVVTKAELAGSGTVAGSLPQPFACPPLCSQPVGLASARTDWVGRVKKAIARTAYKKMIFMVTVFPEGYQHVYPQFSLR
jgi:hypothetical protein